MLKYDASVFNPYMAVLLAVVATVKEYRMLIYGGLMVAMMIFRPHGLLGGVDLARPRLLLLDEPSMGLAPMLVKEIFSIIEEINRSGTTILLVEQNANMALSVANRAYVLETGEIALSGPAAEMADNPEVRKAYLGE